jgi:hemerythrin-like domain-containing protein
MAINTHDMVIVHRAFRREFGLLPKMVATVHPGDTARARIVHDHAREMVSALHHHHEGEDELIWPKLHERAPLDADLLARMESQHEQLSAMLADADRKLPGWKEFPTASSGTELADRFGEISLLLDVHLAEEEGRLLPVAAEHLTAAEWAELGQRGMASMPKSRALVFLAHILEDASDDEAHAFLVHVPPPVRLLYRLIGKPKQRREVAVQRAGLVAAQALPTD